MRDGTNSSVLRWRQTLDRAGRGKRRCKNLMAFARLLDAAKGMALRAELIALTEQAAALREGVS